MGHIFISYSHKDTDYARVLANILQSNGFDIWIDERLDYGSQWPHEIQKYLDTCSAFILIMSPRAFASDWVQSELQRAKRKSKPVFPLLLEGDGPWLSVESTQYYDVRDGQMPNAHFFGALSKLGIMSQTAETYVRLPKSAINKSEPLHAPSKPESRYKTEIWVAIIGAVATLFAACLTIAVPFTMQYFSPTKNPAEPTVYVIKVTEPVTNIQNTPTDSPPPADSIIIEPTNTSVPPTNTSVPPTNTPVPPTVTPVLFTSIYIEAEDGETGNGAYVDAQTTASNSLYVNFYKAGTLKFTIRDFKAGQYNLVVHFIKYVNYTADYPDSGYQLLYVNGDGPITVNYFKTTGDEDNGVAKWGDVSVVISLQQGRNTLLLQNADHGASVDYIYISQ